MNRKKIDQQLAIANNHLERQGHQFRLSIFSQKMARGITIEYGTPEQIERGCPQGVLKGHLTTAEASIFLEAVNGMLILYQTYTFVNNGKEGAATNAEKINRDQIAIHNH